MTKLQSTQGAPKQAHPKQALDVNLVTSEVTSAEVFVRTFLAEDTFSGLNPQGKCLDSHTPDTA